MRLKTVAGAVLGALIACSLCAAPLALAEEAAPGGSAPVLGEPEVEQPTPPTPETFKGQEFAKGSFTYKISKISSAAIEKGSCEVTLLKYTGSGTSATVPATVSYVAGGLGPVTFKVSAIGKDAFNNSKGHKLKSVVVGANISSIADRAFKGCKKLTKITLKGNKIKTIGPNVDTSKGNINKLYRIRHKWKTCNVFSGVPRASVIKLPNIDADKGLDYNIAYANSIRLLAGHAKFYGQVK